jgi:hypothetical protein
MQSSNLKLNESKEALFIVRNYNFLNKKRLEIQQKQENNITPWTKEEDEKLKYLILNYENLSWEMISEKIKGRTPIQCMHRWKNSLNPIIKKGKWDLNEDKIIIEYVKKKGEGNWNQIQSSLVGRTTKQIRERYINHLKNKILNDNENINFKWNEKLDIELIQNYIIYEGSFVKVSENLKGTTPNMVKNRFYSLLRQCVNKLMKNKIYCESQKIKLLKNEIFSQKINNNYNNEYKINKEKNNDLNTIFSNEEISNKSLILFNPELFFNSLNNMQSKKKNYTVKILLEFLPELIEEKGINIERVKTMVNDRKIAITKIVTVLSNHLYIKFMNELNIENKNISNEVKICNVKEGNSKSSILFNMQMAQLGYVIEALKLKMMQTYFERLKRKTLGI